MSRKPDTLGYKEFNKLTDYTDAHQTPLRDQVLFDDENTNPYEEVLMGMEYEQEDLDETKDPEELEDDEDDLELAGVAEDEDVENDINADRDAELDESARFPEKQI